MHISYIHRIFLTHIEYMYNPCIIREWNWWRRCWCIFLSSLLYMQVVSSFIFAAKKRKRTISLTYSQVPYLCIIPCHECTYLCMYVHIYACVHVHVHVCVCVCVCVCHFGHLSLRSWPEYISLSLDIIILLHDNKSLLLLLLLFSSRCRSCSRANLYWYTDVHYINQFFYIYNKKIINY